MEHSCIWRPGAYGDVVCLLSLLSRTASGLPEKLTVLVAPQTFEALSPLVAAMKFPTEINFGTDHLYTKEQLYKDPAVCKLIGYPFDLDGKPQLMEKHLTEYFADELGTLNPDPRAMGGDAEFIELEPGVLEALDTAGLDEYVTIQTTAGWSNTKNWRNDYWADVVKHLHKIGYMVVQLGHDSELPVEGVDIYLPSITKEMGQHIAVQSRAVAHIGLDSVFNHTSAIKWHGTHRVPAVILWGSTNPVGFGYPHNQNIYLNLPCQPCYAVNHCRLEETYPQVCTHAISPEKVIGAINQLVIPKEEPYTPEPVPKPDQPKISAVLIVKNEAEEIRGCLESVKDADEIIVSDTGSEDETCQLVQQCIDEGWPIKLYIDYEWDDDFAAARNHALSKAAGDWVVSIDADERAEPGFMARLKSELMANPGVKTVRPKLVPRANDTEAFFAPRVFKNDGSISWVGRAHEVVSHDDKHDCPDICIRYGYSPAHQKDPNRMLRILLHSVTAEYLKGTKPSHRTLYYLAREFFYRQDYREAIRWFEWRVQEVGFRSECGDAWLYLARCYWNIAEGDKARDCAQQSIQLTPECKEAYLLMAEMSFDTEAKTWRKMAAQATNENVLFVRCK